MCPQISMCISTGDGKGLFLVAVHVADTNKNSNSKASVIHVFENGVCSPGFGRLLMCNTVYFFLFFFFPQSVPKPIALEPCFGNKAAVLSIFVRLPRGTGGIPPPGQSGKTQTLNHSLVCCFLSSLHLFDCFSLFSHPFPEPPSFLRLMKLQL